MTTYVKHTKYGWCTWSNGWITPTDTPPGSDDEKIPETPKMRLSTGRKKRVQKWIPRDVRLARNLRQCEECWDWFNKTKLSNYKGKMTCGPCLLLAYGPDNEIGRYQTSVYAHVNTDGGE